MPNYYQTNRYPRYAITGFASNFTNIERARPLTDAQVLAEVAPSLQEGECIDLVFRFADEQESLALGFRGVSSVKGENEHVYTLVYIAPPLIPYWEQAMDQVQDEYPRRVDDWSAFDVDTKGNELRPPDEQGQWKWAFYLRALVYAIDHQVQRWQEISEETWQLFLHMADQDVASLPEAERGLDVVHLRPALVPYSEEKQDAFQAYCALDVNNRVVPAYVEASARLRLWRANHPNWFSNISGRPREVISIPRG